MTSATPLPSVSVSVPEMLKSIFLTVGFTFLTVSTACGLGFCVIVFLAMMGLCGLVLRRRKVTPIATRAQQTNEMMPMYICRLFML